MSYTKRNLRNCTNCGKIITTTNTSGVVFCSKECMNEYSDNNDVQNTTVEEKIVDTKKKCDVCENDFNKNQIITVNLNEKEKNICLNCNKGLVHFSNNTKFLENAIKFLKD